MYRGGQRREQTNPNSGTGSTRTPVYRPELENITVFSHIMRKNNDNMENLIVRGKVDSKRSRGRTPKTWLD